MEKYIEICNKKVVLVTDDKNILDIRELKEGNRIIVTLLYLGFLYFG